MPVEIDAAAANGHDDDRPEVELLSSGKIRLNVDVYDEETGAESRRVWMLRRPKFGQYRRLRERLYEMQDENQAQVIAEGRRRAEQAEEQAKVEATNAIAQGRTAEQTRAATERMLDQLEETYEATRAARERTDQAEVSYLAWTREAVKTLSGRPLDLPDEDVPYILVTSEFVTAVQRHWRTVPFGSGGTTGSQPFLATAGGR